MIQQEIFQLIQDLTGQKNLIVIPRLFILKLGDYPSAALLAQCIYWSSKIEQEGWFYKTYKEWEDEICLSKDQAIKASKKLKKLELIQTKVKKAPTGNPTVFYRVDLNALCSWLVVKPYYRKLDSTTFVSSKKLLSSITENTSKTTVEMQEKCLSNFTNNAKRYKKDLKTPYPPAAKKDHNMDICETTQDEYKIYIPPG